MAPCPPQLIAERPLPAFSTAQHLLDAFGKGFFAQGDIDEMRHQIHKDLCDRASLAIKDELGNDASS
jgi:hypothetical protein